MLGGLKYIQLVKRKPKVVNNTNTAPSTVCAGDMEVSTLNIKKNNVQ